MLLSMTGHGHGRYSNDGLSISTEIRTVNSRYAKVNVRCGEAYQSLEPKVEELVRKKIRRGTIQVNIKIDRRIMPGNIVVNEAILQQYVESAQKATPESSISAATLMTLPGVIEQANDQSEGLDADWEKIVLTIDEALKTLAEMRSAEGESMLSDLLNNCDSLEAELNSVKSLAPGVVQSYQTRLTERINLMLKDTGVELDPSDMIKEVGVFADRSDISEEVVRLSTHVEQFRNVMGEKESQGRKLDFLTQEMFRETNTIGSKANDAQISQHVVEMKTVIERIREMVQNIE